MGKLLGILAGTVVLCGVFLAMVVPTILPDPSACENLDAGAAVPEDVDDPGASGSFTSSIASTWGSRTRRPVEGEGD